MMTTTNRSTRFAIIILSAIAFIALAIASGLFIGSFILHRSNPVVSPSTPLLPLPSEETTDVLSHYRELWTAQAMLPHSIPDLIQLSTKNDGAGYHALVTLARCDEVSLEERIEYYRQAITLHDLPELKLELSDLLLRATSIDEAIATLATALPHPGAANRLVGIDHDPLTIAEHLSARGFHDSVLQVLQHQDSAPARLLRARAFLATGKAASIPSELFPVDALPETEQPLAYFLIGRAYELLHRPGDALAAYASSGQLGAYRRAIILQSRGELAAAAESFCASTDPESRWRGGLLLERLGRSDDALVVYSELMTGSHRLSDDAAFRAWLLARRLGRTEIEIDAVPHIPRDSHWQYQIGSMPEFVFEPELVVVYPHALLVADALIERYDNPVAFELALFEVQIVAGRGDLAEVAACALWYKGRELYTESVRLGMSLLNRTRSITAYRLAYPRPYSDLVMAAAAEFGVDPLLLWSIMREESHFMSQALSSAGALGLMQIMPETGRWIASMLGEEFTITALTDPETNIRWAAWYVANLNKTWDGNLLYVLASYNGGQGNVRNWQQSPLYEEPGDFFGLIPFTETREYVTKVKNSLVHYRRLYD